MLPFYGDPELLRRAVRSVQQQSRTDWRLTVVDDGYPDDCPVRRTGSNDEAADARHVVGATAWFFTRDENVQAFDWLFVDEAGQATEPEVMIGIKTMADNDTNVVLAGDPKQLGPIIRSAVARELGLEKSYLERMMESSAHNAQRFDGYT